VSAYWIFWLGVMVLGGFAIPEGYAIATKQQQGTLSANIRAWLKTDTPGGGWSWLGVWLTLAAILGWLGGHIMHYWP
jgi:hypothetical protein